MSEGVGGGIKSPSVAVASFNGESYIYDQLLSVQRQTNPPVEIVVFDDLSEDGTLSVVQRFAQESVVSVRLEQQKENVGYIRNFSSALSSCSGDVVFLCDQDDVWLPNKIERMLAVFASRPDIVLAIHDLEFCDENLSPIGQTKIGRMSTGQDIQRDYVVGMATAVRGDFLRLCLPIPDVPGVTHDKWLHDCALAVNGKLVVREVLALDRKSVV